jgi:hypothetical protein
MGYLFKFDPNLLEIFLECVFFLIENIDMILTLIHKRKRKRKTGNKKEHIVPVFLFGSVRYDCFSKYFSLKNTSK